MSLKRTVAILTIVSAFLTAPIAAKRKPGRCSTSENPTDPNQLNQQFTKNLHQLISRKYANENVVFSPMSLQSILSLIYTGASGKSADELRSALALPSNNTLNFDKFKKFMRSSRSPSMELQLANKLYFKKGKLKMRAGFRNNAKKYFNTEIERVQFGDKRVAAENINHWVAHKTNNKLRNMIRADDLDENIVTLLVNAIYFKGKWELPFLLTSSHCSLFWMNQNQSVLVDMLYQRNQFNYIDLSLELGARAIQLKYAKSEMSMLLLLPNDHEGLAALQSRIQNFDLINLPKRMETYNIDLWLPRFTVEAGFDMRDILKELQIVSLFNDNSGLAGIFGKQEAEISKLQHQAKIEVNEHGSEHTTAATSKVLASLDIGYREDSFRANHPFMYAIISPHAVYFMGHVVNLSKNCMW